MDKETDLIVTVGSVVAAVIMGIVVLLITGYWNYGLIAGGASLILCMLAQAILRLISIFTAIAKRGKNK